MIEVKHLTKRYGEQIAVDDLTFTIEDGLIYGFLGPNGAGKTTTMNILTGYLSMTDGEVTVNGHDILEEPEQAKKTIGYLPEIPPVYPDMTVSEYLKFAAELKMVMKRDRRSQIEAVISELGLDDVKGRLIRNLSKGYKQRVGFAQALLGDPQTLILDEPTVGLDPRQIIEIRALIRRLGKKHTVILSSHILSEVSEICDRIMIISHGRLTAFDTPENLTAARKTGNRILLTAEGSRTAVVSSIRKVTSLKDDDVSETSDGHVKAVIRVPESKDLRSRISRALFEQGCAVVEMKIEKESLEDIFLDLTESETDVDGPVTAREAASEMEEED